MKRKYHLFLFSLLCIACTTSPLEKALEESGVNRPQLEKVLAHYSVSAGDSLKYRATCFLIENMPGHGWYEGEALTRYRHWVDSTYPGIRDDQRQMLYQAPLSKPFIVKTLQRKEDIASLDADFLTGHIERTFAAWKTLPWLKDLSFADFCEYILPYRCAEEDPRNRVCMGDSMAVERLRQAVGKYDDIAYNPAEVRKIYSPIGQYLTLPGVSEIRFAGRKFAFEPAGCIPAALCELFDHRSRWVPAAIDFTPAFPHLNNRHYWVSLSDLYSPVGSRTFYQNERVGKVYRKVFSHQPVPEPEEGEFIPPFFRIPFHKDVTDRYASVTEVRIPVKTGGQHVYLCVFNDRKWTPVAFAPVKGKQAVFRKVGTGVVYLPVVYQGMQQVPVGFPFIPQRDGSIRVLRPDASTSRSLCLKRKFPLRYPVFHSVRELADCRIEASCDSLFHCPVVVAEIKETGNRGLKSVRLQTDKAYRYWRLHFPGKGMVVAELMFCDSLGKRFEVQHFLSSGHALERPAVAFDGNPLSYCYVDRWIGVDFGRPVQPELFRGIGRNDDNGIWPGDIYELFYQGKEGWISLGSREATADTLNFPGIPSGCLLLLKNYSRGKDERIFTFDEEGIVRFY